MEGDGGRGVVVVDLRGGKYDMKLKKWMSLNMIVMGHGIGPYLGLDEIGSSSSIMIFILISYLFNRTF